MTEYTSTGDVSVADLCGLCWLVGGNPASAETVLLTFPYIEQWVESSPHSDMVVGEFLRTVTTPDILCEVCLSPEAPPYLLQIASLSHDSDVRWHVAANEHTPPRVLAHLLHDDDTSVRNVLVSNLSTPPEVLYLLHQEENHLSPHLRTVSLASFAANPHTPESIVMDITKSGTRDALEILASHPHHPQWVWDVLSTSTHVTVRTRVAVNDNTPLGVLTRLTEDDDLTVSGYASRTLHHLTHHHHEK